MRDIFSNIYHSNYWNDKDSVSGAGSNLEATAALRLALPPLLAELGVQTMIDIPCGDFYWFKEMDLPDIKYIGADIVPELVAFCAENYSDENHTFLIADASKRVLPPVDLILCRDMLGHLTNDDVRKVLKNFARSGTRYLLATTFPGRDPNQDIQTGQWRPIDLEALRFGLGPAMLLVDEKCGEGNGKFTDKMLGLWEL